MGGSRAEARGSEEGAPRSGGTEDDQRGEMSYFRSAGLGAVLLLVTGCAGVPEPVVAPVPDPEPKVLGVPVRPEPEPELSLEERWRSPFAVASRGSLEARPQRTVVVAASSAAGSAAAAPSRADESSPAPSTESPVTEGREPAVPPAGIPTPPAGERPGAERATAGEPASAGGGLRTHRVEWGETWLGLARRYGVRSDALAALNPEVDPERLRAGEVLLVPAPDTAAEAPGRTHTVAPGDSLWGVSRRYGVSMERLQEVNRLSDHRLRIGQVLIIP